MSTKTVTLVHGTEETLVDHGQSLGNAITARIEQYLGLPEKRSYLVDGSKKESSYILEEGDTVVIEQEDSTKGAKGAAKPVAKPVKPTAKPKGK